MRRIVRGRGWLWVVDSGLGLCVVISVCVVLVTHNRASKDSQASETFEPGVVVPSSSPTIESVITTVDTPPQIPRLDFPPGSVGDACGLNEFIPYNVDDPDNEYYWPKSPYDKDGKLIALESEVCRTALEKHINTINPYLYLWGAARANSSSFAFVVLDEPLTFERIFSDPTGDLLRVQDALSRPECMLIGDETSQELKETCHAEAFLNYALINRFCYETPSTQYFDDKGPLLRDGVSRRKRTYYLNDPTPEQDRFMWKQDLEDAWVRDKCEQLDSTLELTEHHSELYELVISLRDPAEPWSKVLAQKIDSKVMSNEWATEVLIELAARLGDDAAGLTHPTFDIDGWYREDGYKYGRFARLLTSTEWREFAEKKHPTTDRFLQTFHMLAMVSARRLDPRDEIKFDWEFVARHLCEPPYEESESYYREDEESPELQSCKEIVHELRQRDLKFAPLLQALDKFEQVAIELGVYQ